MALSGSRTRRPAAAKALLGDIFCGSAGARERFSPVFDFRSAIPRVRAASGLLGTLCRRMGRDRSEVQDDEKNDNNRFAVATDSTPNLEPTPFVLGLSAALAGPLSDEASPWPREGGLREAR